jgi:hypothetical protein
MHLMQAYEAIKTHFHPDRLPTSAPGGGCATRSADPAMDNQGP